MIQSINQALAILKESKEVGKDTIPNGPATLQVQYFLAKKYAELPDTSDFARNFKELQAFLQESLRYATGVIASKYGALPAKLAPAEKIICLLVPISAHPTFATFTIKSSAYLIIPVDLLADKRKDTVRRMLVHEFLHNCAKLHHKEEFAAEVIAKHQKEMVHMAGLFRGETIAISSMLLKKLEAKGEERGMFHRLIPKFLSKRGYAPEDFNKLLADKTNFLIYSVLERFDNLIFDLGINVVVGMLNLDQYILEDLSISKNNTDILKKTISHIEKNQSVPYFLQNFSYFLAAR